ncbi:MAG: hypothetical protein ACYDG3_14500 [Bacillati bacterium]
MAEDDILMRAAVVAPFRTRQGPPRNEPVKKRCSSQARAFMMSALRELEKISEDKLATIQIGSETVKAKPSIEVPVSSFARIGLKNREAIVDTLEACPESFYVKAEPTDGTIKLTLERRMNV